MRSVHTEHIQMLLYVKQASEKVGKANKTRKRKRGKLSFDRQTHRYKAESYLFWHAKCALCTHRTHTDAALSKASKWESGGK
eukprot:jgi/Antlo1/1109/2416